MEHELGFESCLRDYDVWRRYIIQRDRHYYYEYLLLYVDDSLVASEFGEEMLRKRLDPYFNLKEKLIGPPKIYLERECFQGTTSK